MPALPLDEAGKYVAAAYLVFLVLILIYVAIMAARLQRIDRELADLADLAEAKAGDNKQGGVEGKRGWVGEPPRNQGGAAGTSGEAAVDTQVPAATMEPEPAGNAAEGEASGGEVLR
jgi:hypothetical protein